MSRPNVIIKEESIAAAILSSATGRMAYVVQSVKGITNDYLYIESEKDLQDTIGIPTDETYARDYEVCKAFLAYGNDLVLRRAIDRDTAQLSRIGYDFSATGTGETLTDSITDTGDNVFFENSDLKTTLKTGMDLEFYSRNASVDFNNLTVAISKFDGTGTGELVWADNSDTIDGTTTFASQMEFGPDSTAEEFAIIVSLSGTVVEKFIVSLDSTNKNSAGENNYIYDYIKAKSDYIYAFAKSTLALSEVESFTNISLANGTPGSTPSAGDFELAYSAFLQKNEIKFDYITEGNHSGNRAYIINSIADVRKDCIAFVGPKSSDILNITNTDTITSNIVADRLSLGNSSWASYTGNWKKVRSNALDKEIFIPITGDIIGNKVRVNTDRELWIPAAGNTNGRIKNVISLAYDPTAGQQDTLYNNGVNHVVFKAGKGFIVDGQKTMWPQNVGVARVHNRDLFRLCEDYVADIAEDFLHEFNNAQTQQRFVNLVNPFLEDIKNRGGIVDFEVIADATLNTPAVVDSNGFRAEVKIKGQRPIENITITFFDVPTGIAFSEL